MARAAHLALLATGAVMAAGTAPAGAAVRPAPGWYGGEVAGTAIGVRVTKTGTLRALRTGGVRASCADGTRRLVSIPARSRKWSPSARTGRFSSRAPLRTAWARGTFSIKGRFGTRRRATGLLRIRFTAPGGTACDTEAKYFSVSRRRTEPVPPLPWRIFAGHTADDSVLELGMTPDGTGLRPARMVAKMACSAGGSVTLEITNPPGENAAAGPTFSGSWRFTPPAIAGHPSPSGGAIQLSGRVTAKGVEGAARMTIGFSDGSSCDGGWTLFSFPGDTRTAAG